MIQAHRELQNESSTTYTETFPLSHNPIPSLWKDFFGAEGIWEEFPFDGGRFQDFGDFGRFSEQMTVFFSAGSFGALKDN